MIKMKKIWSHFKTITEHKLLVMKYCFKVGLYKQGLLHDLSKYSPEEFWTKHGCITKEEISTILSIG